MKRIQLSLLLLASTFAFAACQTMPYQPYAREVKKRPNDGGLIALKTEHRDEDRAKAQQLMASNCGGKPVKVLEEGEVVTGTKTDANSSARNVNATQGSQVGSLFGMPLVSGGSQGGQDTNVSSTTTQVKEWQISYECEKGMTADASAASSATGITPVKAIKTRKSVKQ